jgi:hypothetical protein
MFSGNFFMAYISSYADVASKSPANFKPKPSLFLSTAIPKFDAITYPSQYNVGLRKKVSSNLGRPGKRGSQPYPNSPREHNHLVSKEGAV